MSDSPQAGRYLYTAAVEEASKPLSQLGFIALFPIRITAMLLKVVHDDRCVVLINKHEIDLLKRFAASLRAHEVNKDDRDDATPKLLCHC